MDRLHSSQKPKRNKAKLKIHKERARERYSTPNRRDGQDNQLPPAIAVNQNPAPRTMYDYAKPSSTGTGWSIVRPAVAANTFELKPNTIQMIQQFVQFDGL